MTAEGSKFRIGKLRKTPKMEVHFGDPSRKPRILTSKKRRKIKGFPASAAQLAQ